MSQAAPTPRVSVLMPVFNAQAHLRQALESVLSQTWRDFEFIIIDDGSTDQSAAILAHYQAQDARVRVYPQPNQGLVAALNRGLGLARGAYLARMDADDVSLPERLARQLGFLERNPNVVACGSWVRVAGGPARAVWRYPETDAAIRAHLLFEPPFCHPAVMIRREVLARAGLVYNPEFREAEDYELWARLAGQGALANLPQVLLDYRVHPGQKRQLAPEAVASYANRVRQAELARLGILPSAEEIALHQALGEGRPMASEAFLQASEGWLRRLQAAQGEREAYPEPAFTTALGQRWFQACRRASHLGWRAWRIFWRSPLSGAAGLSAGRRLKFALRCLLRVDTP